MAEDIRIPAVPDVPVRLTEHDIYTILEPLKRIIDIRQGKFDINQRWATYQDLIDFGTLPAATVEQPVIIVPPTVQFDFNLSGDIVGGPTTLADGTDPITMSTIINLPNVVCIDGGDAAETFPPSTEGPYGVLGSGSALTVQDNGVSLSSATTLLNFIGFNITEPLADQIHISIGVSAASSEYAPGYTSYTRVDDNEFTIDLIDAENLFYVGRRVKFDKGGVFDFGTISAVDFNITSANDTHVTLTMEVGDTVPTGVFDVILVSSATAWSPIAGDPFGGTPINDITTGLIGATQWWFAVGNSGKIATSNDGGATWTLRTTVSTNHINVCTYDSDNETFWAGGDTGDLFSSTDGTTIVEDTTSIQAITSTGTGDIKGMAYSTGESGLGIMYKDTINDRFASTQDQGTTWSARGTLGQSNLDKNLHAARQGAFPASGNAWYTIIFNNTLDWTLSTITDPSWSSSNSIGAAPTCGVYFFDVSQAKVFGHAGGNITGVANWAGDDTVTFTQPIRDFAWSPAHARLVCVGDNQTLGYLDSSSQDTNDAWTSIANGFAPTANIKAVEWNASDGLFIAVADNGQICRSSNGTN